MSTRIVHYFNLFVNGFISNLVIFTVLFIARFN